MSNMSKKKIIAMMALIIVIAILGTGTLAYFTTRAVVHNVITSGEIKIELVETQDLDNNPATPETDYPEKTVEGLMPGQDHSKIVRVKNVSSNPAWVRIKMTVLVEDSAGKDLGPEALDINYHTGTGEDWLVKDGVYYYKAKLESGESTTPLFDTVSFREDMNNDYQNAEIRIIVEAEAIQYQNNTNFDTAWPDGIEILENLL